MGCQGEGLLWVESAVRRGWGGMEQGGACTLVGALLQLLVVGRLLGHVQDRDRQLGVGERERLRVGCGVGLCGTTEAWVRQRSSQRRRGAALAR